MRSVLKCSCLMLWFLFAVSTTAWGCLCDTPQTVDTAFKEATAIFAGKYIGSEYRKGIKNQFREIDGTRDEYEVLVYKFSVKTWWKGAGTREVILISDNTRSLKDRSETISDCGLGFETGREYLIYAYGTGDDFGTGACTRTARLKRAAADIKRLNGLAKPRKAAASF